MQLMWIRICCACAIVLAAFAHQPVALADGSTSVSQYTLPDGTVLSLCLYSPADDEQTASPSCEFCRIAQGADVTPPCVGDLGIVEAAEKQPARPVALHPRSAIFQPATPLRGPPISA